MKPTKYMGRDWGGGVAEETSKKKFVLKANRQTKSSVKEETRHTDVTLKSCWTRRMTLVVEHPPWDS